MAKDYRLIGDFWMKGEPFNSKARIFLHPQGETFVEIGNTLDTDYCEMLTFLDDGSVISTANCDPLDMQKELAEHGYHVQCHPGMQLAEMMNKHDEFLASIQQHTGTDIRPIPFTRWQEYFHYHNRRFGEIKFLIGKGIEAPENAEFPASDSEQFETAESVG